MNIKIGFAYNEACMLNETYLDILVMLSQNFIVVSVILLFGCKLAFFIACSCAFGQSFVIIGLILSVDR